MTTRRAVIEWPDGTEATLSATGWTVNPSDSKLEELLNARFGPIAIQARRDELAEVGRAPVIMYPDLLAACAQSAALGLGAEVSWVDPPDRVLELERKRA